MPVFKVYTTPDFIDAAEALKRKYPNIKDDFYSLLQKLKTDPVSGHTSMGGGLYKIRLKISDKSTGERDGGRVIVEVRVKNKMVVMIYCYDKSEMSKPDDRHLEILTLRAKAYIAEKYKSKE